MAIEFTVDHDHTYAGEDGIEPLIGWITFSVTTYPGDFRVREQGAGVARTMNIPPRRGWLAADGHLYKDQTLEQPCRLVANDPIFNLRNLTYRADFDLTTVLGDPVPVPLTYFAAPSTDTTLQLTKVMTDPSQPVMEVRAKLYVEDIMDLAPIGESLMTATDGASAKSAINADFYVNVKDFGALGDGVNDDTEAIQSAINTGLRVFIPSGTWLVSGLALPAHSTIRGAGMSQTIIKHASNSTSDCMKSATEYTPCISLSDFTIDGNKANQSSALYGLYISNTGDHLEHSGASKFGFGGPHHSISDVLILNCKGTGFRMSERGVAFVDRVWVHGCDGHGFHIDSFDSHYSQLDAGVNGLAGFYITGAVNRLTNIKAWYSGQITPASGQGIVFTGAACYENSVTNATVQAPATAGLLFDTGSGPNTVTNLTVIGPSYNDGGMYGVHYKTSNNQVIGAVLKDNGSAPYDLEYGVVLDGASAINNVFIGNSLNHLTARYALLNSGTLSRNILIMQGRFIHAGQLDVSGLPSYASDALASAVLGIGEWYYNTSTRALTRVTDSTTATTTAVTVGSIELGDATANTLTASSGVLSVEGVPVPLNSTSSAHIASTIELGHATDTTLSRSASGVVAVEGKDLVDVSTTQTVSGKILKPLTNSTTTSAGTLTMTVADATTQIFAGSTTHTVKLPTTGVTAGMVYTIINNSSASVTVQSSGANDLAVVGAGRQATFTAGIATPVAAADWKVIAPTTAITVAGKIPVSDANGWFAFAGSYGYPTSTATSAGTLTMNATQTQTQILTGSTTHTVKLPTTGVAAGTCYTIINQSSGDVTVQSSGSNTIGTLSGAASPTAKLYIALQATPTTAAHWREI